MDQPIKRHSPLALLGALCLFLSTIEYLIPKPLPFIRIGIANIPIMLAIDLFPFSSFLLLVMLKVIGQAILTGSLFSYVFLFSLGGTLTSALGMFVLRRLIGKNNISFIGIGLVGAILSNGVQIGLAWLFIFGPSAQFIAPPLLLLGFITGLLLGIFCQNFSEHSLWYKRALQEHHHDTP
ncbi:Gx transporter family protein [Gracilinema caldarium]|uniref:Heptaprenyl diphosphate synthase component I n=1 Tax=Gracilinema caldarium (strain ATCC 51460 / DSM 7334 / H1) TaxID=744872 RepID=F8EWS2_GRAC1|nr:Gx transporter family protein [Gracilinema caldarium]AEJ18308.1 Heptaprenyl diphosphate synthase component I [Gracilinema caldarium DSM 7334]